MTNGMREVRMRLKDLIGHLEEAGKPGLAAQGKDLAGAMDQWDSTMVQRLSKAYDDVENYVNGFTAEYLTALNHGDSGIPRVNKGTKEKIAALNRRWAQHRATARRILDSRVPGFNAALQEAGIGALYLPPMP